MYDIVRRSKWPNFHLIQEQYVQLLQKSVQYYLIIWFSDDIFMILHIPTGRPLHTTENHCPTMIYTVKPTRQGPRILFNTSLMFCIPLAGIQDHTVVKRRGKEFLSYDSAKKYFAPSGPSTIQLYIRTIHYVRCVHSQGCS